ncbi:hypothetical protein VTP01DRAFT_5338 [Rhizomucor pusillus]|uniref:uncharacterized protein n=1 Tax=Rhizomucor pusillus TaxID=4840 RepID=UPI0037428826
MDLNFDTSAVRIAKLTGHAQELLDRIDKLSDDCNNLRVKICHAAVLGSTQSLAQARSLLTLSSFSSSLLETKDLFPASEQ